ncbi:predicted protein [Botrytis cinerea T4]|uniref:Uncharacterized protein n=1 Tax=Botryotinia fuckeliana (strain T4) TaxID=999810 RepID=G2XZ79_BOTF4|nr:predicted protein [Botrytis cinerea T4]
MSAHDLSKPLSALTTRTIPYLSHSLEHPGHVQGFQYFPG